MAVAQTLEVLLRAVGLSQYTSDMGQAATATGRVGTEATSSFTTVGQKLQGAGQSLQEFGSTITPVSLAVAGLGSAATFVGANYDREFTKITTLVGVSADEVQRMKATTLDLAGETARAPQELASAMFTIQSAGLRGAEGAEALRIAAQGSAIGMGDTRDIAQALTGILNAYATSNITAAEAGDFLVATARAGNFEVSQLAGSLGRVLPIASAAGVELEDVGGSIALLTRNGLSASEAVTQTNAVLRGLVAPSQEAQQALDDAGLSFEDIRRIVQEQGLVAGIQALNEAAGGSQEQFVKLVGGSEAASAAFTILNADAGTIEGTFGAVAASAGLMEGAFGQLQESDAFRLDRALNEIKAEFTDFSQVVVPVAADA